MKEPTQHQSVPSFGKSWPDIFFRIFYGSMILAVLIFCGSMVKKEYKDTFPKFSDHLEKNYFSIGSFFLPETLFTAKLGPRLWLETGKHGKRISPLVTERGYSVQLKHFSVGRMWSRAIAWFISADRDAFIELRFPPGQTSGVLLFLTDGNSVFRASRIRSGKSDLIADRLNNGRWYYLPIEADERENGFKQIRLQRLSGANIAVSAIVLF